MTPLVVAAAALVAAAVVVLLLAPARVASAVRAVIGDRVDALERGQERLDRAVREELAHGRDAAAREGAQLRAELHRSSRDLAAAVAGQITGMASLVQRDVEAFSGRLVRLTDANERRLAELRATVDAKLQAIQEDSARRLEAMRQVVEEKLQGTLDRRLGESFRQVSERLEAVQKGLGEVSSLAGHVGDLKKVLTNVKTRGTWGEVQLGALLEQVLAPGQFVANAQPKPASGERVEFAIRLPGREGAQGEVLLPIDAKFPVEDYLRLVDASERGDAAGVEDAARHLVARVKACARDVHDKYLDPPRTTDFALLYVPTEGLFAEVARRPGLLEALQRDFKVTVAGPTTLLALLNALQMGFSSLAIQKRSSEVWQLLGAVKAEFARFGTTFEKVGRKLDEAKSQLDEVGRRRSAIERRLRDVQELPSEPVQRLAPANVIAVEPDDGVPA